MFSVIGTCRLLFTSIVCLAVVVCQPTVQEFRWSETCMTSRDEDFREALDYVLMELKRQSTENRLLREEVNDLKQKTNGQRLLLLQLSDSVSLLVEKLVLGNSDTRNSNIHNTTCNCATQNDGHVSMLDPWPKDTIVISGDEKDKSPSSTSSTTPTTTTPIPTTSPTSETTTETTTIPTSPTPDPLLALYGGTVPTDCADIQRLGFSTNGTYPIRPNGSSIHFPVVCEFHEGSVWTLIQRRIDGALDFYKSWEQYKNGFGNLSSEFWLGNEKIHLLTRQRIYKLGMDMWDWSEEGKETETSQHYFSQSSYFRVGNESSHYELNVPQDYFSYTGFGGSGLRVHAGPFLTYDHTVPRVSGNCAEQFHCGWWFSTCVRNANFNGRYYDKGYENANTRKRSRDDIYWPNIEVSLRKTTLKIQRQDDFIFV